MARKSNWTLERVKKAVELSAAGSRHKDIAERFGVSVSGVNRAFSSGIPALGVGPLRDMVQELKRAERDEILAEAADDAEVNEELREHAQAAIKANELAAKANETAVLREWSSARLDAVKDAKTTMGQEAVLIRGGRELTRRMGAALMDIMEGLESLAPAVRDSLQGIVVQATEGKSEEGGGVNPMAALDLFETTAKVMTRYAQATKMMVETERVRVGDPRDLVPADEAASAIDIDEIRDIRGELDELAALLCGGAIVVDDDGEPLPPKRKAIAQRSEVDVPEAVYDDEDDEDGELVDPADYADLIERGAAMSDEPAAVSRRPVPEPEHLARTDGPEAMPDEVAPTREAERPNIPANPAHVARVLEIIKTVDRLAIVGGPWTGKTTLLDAVEAHKDFVSDYHKLHHADDCIDWGTWEDQPKLIRDMVGHHPIFIIEGVQVARALRKRVLRVDAVLYIRGTYAPKLRRGQEKMRVDVENWLTEWRGVNPGIKVHEILAAPAGGSDPMGGRSVGVI